jgi:chromate reductase, NAD(P)H dehydrogenase (quinone)
MSDLKVLAFAGSLRKASYNRGALRAAQETAPPDIKIEIFDLNGIPAFNEDDEANPVEIVRRFREKITASDAILIATPEYNYSIPGVLKNAIDWGSRPYAKGALNNKPVAIMGASPGAIGTARAQYDLRRVFVTLNMYCVNKPEVLIGNAKERFDADGNLTDEKTKKFIQELVVSLAALTRKLKT